MPKFKFWYKKEIIADTLVKAIKKEPKVKLIFDSINQDDKSDQDLTPCIGFGVNQDEDYDE